MTRSDGGVHLAGRLPHTSTIDNPYWALLKSRPRRTRPLVARDPAAEGGDGEVAEPAICRRDTVQRYSWTIPDDTSLAFVVEHSRGRIVDPLAGTGYWCYLLTQLGVDCIASDACPPAPEHGTNRYHPNQTTWLPVRQADAVRAAAEAGADRTLLLSWPPPKHDTAYRALRAYPGNRVIYIGEGPETCADEDLFTLLDTEWSRIAWHVPVRWDSASDVITVHRRR